MNIALKHVDFIIKQKMLKRTGMSMQSKFLKS
ncbi:Uncharacterised protein [Klebsiella pneumoniae]|nr:Uncharacterised protein [Klebsiella pneumoniae]SVT98858.1 Uncharacterised protein [Klebsiella pneumoniae]SXD81973.1 Uncharacterised protein [Klebsiella variicola]SXF70558.1 Uncharacterised protein [Klebsiella variicola]